MEIASKYWQINKAEYKMLCALILKMTCPKKKIEDD